MLLAITAPPGNERGPLYTEQALAAIHRANPARRPVTFAFGCHQKTIGLYCHVPRSPPKNFLDPLIARYPGCGLHELAPTALDPPEGSAVYTAELRLRRDLFPINRYPQFADEESGEAADPLTGILDFSERD